MPLPIASLALSSLSSGGDAKLSVGKVTVNDFTATYLSDAKNALEKHIVAAATLVQGETKHLLNQGASNKGKTPSKPGEPPHKDQGNLGRGIEIESARTATGEFVTRVGPANFAKKYGAALEFGTKNMAPRPFLRPAMDNKEEEVAALVAKGIKVASSGKGTFRDPSTGKFTSGG